MWLAGVNELSCSIEGKTNCNNSPILYIATLSDSRLPHPLCAPLDFRELWWDRAHPPTGKSGQNHPCLVDVDLSLSVPMVSQDCNGPVYPHKIAAVCFSTNALQHCRKPDHITIASVRFFQAIIEILTVVGIWAAISYLREPENKSFLFFASMLGARENGSDRFQRLQSTYGNAPIFLQVSQQL